MQIHRWARWWVVAPCLRDEWAHHLLLWVCRLIDIWQTLWYNPLSLPTLWIRSSKGGFPNNRNRLDMLILIVQRYTSMPVTGRPRPGRSFLYGIWILNRSESAVCPTIEVLYKYDTRTHTMLVWSNRQRLSPSRLCGKSNPMLFCALFHAFFLSFSGLGLATYI